MTTKERTMKSSHPKSNFQKETSCVPTCCAKLELGSLFCTHCRTSGLMRLAAEGLESEDVELPAFPLIHHSTTKEMKR
jgi:hypothetical protein